MEYNSNPKALNLDILEEDTSGRKVTLGFKCSPQLKLELATEAQEKGYSLSEYVESIIESQTDQNAMIERLKSQMNQLQTTVDLYEKNGLIDGLFNMYKGQVIPIGKNESRKIETVQDIIFVIFKSFKFEKK